MSLIYNSTTRAAKTALNRRGFDVARYPAMRTILQRYQLAVDAGAADGDTRDWMRGFGYCGTILSVEANRALFKKMVRRHTVDHKWVLTCACLSDREGDCLFNVAEDDAFSRIGGGPGAVTMRTRRLETFFDTNDTRPLFLKTDCEGHDLAIVRGMGKHLLRVGHALMEVSTTPRHAEDPAFADVVAAMASLGFGVAFVLGNHWNDGQTKANALDVMFEKLKG